MLNQQDLQYHMLSTLNPTAYVIEAKVFCKKGQNYILDTAVVPGTGANLDYWDAGFCWSLQTGVA
jgi:hypothetical protein